MVYLCSEIAALCLRRIESWEQGDAAEFPYDSVLACYHAHGKHFVPWTVLEALAGLREKVAAMDGARRDVRQLTAFLAVALDKWDGTYDYLTYLGISLLDLTPEADGATARRQRDEWLALLLADLLAFENAARDGDHQWLPLMRPGPELLDKRSRLLDAALAPVLIRTGAPGSAGDDVRSDARGPTGSEPARHRGLILSMQPVFVAHDEYLFIRVLQSFEVTFAAMAAEMRDAIGLVARGRAQEAAATISQCADGLRAARGLFSLLATMRAESFQVFREFTVGASAIQSGNYKTFEALCSQPAEHRVQSPAYEAVPELRDRVRGNWTNLASVVSDAISHAVIGPGEAELLAEAARDLEDVHQRWKQTHWKLAVRMIGPRTGTGYTVGTPYLRQVLENRLFPDPTFKT